MVQFTRRGFSIPMYIEHGLMDGYWLTKEILPVNLVKSPKLD